jgi:hypothetical protein
LNVNGGAAAVEAEVSANLASPEDLDIDEEVEDDSIDGSMENISYIGAANTNWKTLVLISVNLAGFEIKMNVGNVMGNVCLLTKNARAISKISISRFGPKDMKFNFALDNSRLIAEGGSNGCLLRIQDITAAIEINEKKKGCPSHKLDFGIYAAECRVDSAYNQTSPILAFRLSSLSLRLNDTWESSLAAFHLAEPDHK